MPEVPTSNVGSTYYNGNECRSFNIRVNSSSIARLSGLDSVAPWTGQRCSEVFIVNKSGGNVELFDRADAWDNEQATAASRGFLLADNDSVTLRGLTNVNQVSAQGSGNGTIYYRTQYYSSNPIR